MAKYLLLYRAATDASAQMAQTTPEQAQAGMELWMNWFGKAGSAIVDGGSPLATKATVGTANTSSLPIAGYSIIEAKSLAAAKQLVDGHPHFEMPGDTAIEILEVLPPPGM
jgi:hypothetical protein